MRTEHEMTVQVVPCVCYDCGGVILSVLDSRGCAAAHLTPEEAQTVIGELFAALAEAKKRVGP